MTDSSDIDFSKFEQDPGVVEAFRDWLRQLDEKADAARVKRAKSKRKSYRRREMVDGERFDGVADGTSVREREEVNREMRKMDVTEVSLSGVEDWYTWGRFVVPVFGSREYARFVATGASMLIKDKEMDKKRDIALIRITPTVDTACIDLSPTPSLEDSEDFLTYGIPSGIPIIYLPDWYFDETLYTPISKASLAAAALTNGSIIHESLHIKYTKETPERVVLRCLTSKDVEVWRDRGQMAYSVFNILEDLYIEAEDRLMSLGLSRMFVDIKNMLLLTEEKLRSVLDLVFKETGGEMPKDYWNKTEGKYSWESLLLFVSIGAGFKSKMLWPFLKTIFPEPILKEVMIFAKGKLDSIQTRAIRTSNFLRLFNPPPEEEYVSASSFSILSMMMTQEERESSTEGEKYKATIRAFQELMKKGKSSMLGPEGKAVPSLEGKYMSSGKEGASSTFFEMSDSEKIAASITRSIILPEEYAPEALPDQFRSLTRMPILPPRQWVVTYGLRTIPKVKSLGFLSQLRRVKTVNNTPGKARTTGAIVPIRLYRIGIDSKVCAIREMHRQDVGEAEVVILIDASGSTGYHNAKTKPDDEVFEYDDEVYNVYEREAAFGLALYKDLASLGVPCALLFHTSRQIGTDDPYMGIVASTGFGKDVKLTKETERLLKALKLKENYDGYAIAEAGFFFTERPRKKILFVLSDGIPSGIGYSGSPAIEHTEAVVGLLRKKGINVFCVSLIQSVVDSNDIIYGRRFNIRPKRFGAEMRKKVINLVKYK